MASWLGYGVRVCLRRREKGGGAIHDVRILVAAAVCLLSHDAPRVFGIYASVRTWRVRVAVADRKYDDMYREGWGRGQLARHARDGARRGAVSVGVGWARKRMAAPRALTPRRRDADGRGGGCVVRVCVLIYRKTIGLLVFARAVFTMDV